MGNQYSNEQRRGNFSSYLARGAVIGLVLASIKANERQQLQKKINHNKLEDLQRQRQIINQNRLEKLQRQRQRQKYQQQRQIQRLKRQMRQKNQKMQQQKRKLQQESEKSILQQNHYLQYVKKKKVQQQKKIILQRQNARVQAIKQQNAMNVMQMSLKQSKKQFEDEKRYYANPNSYRQSKDQVFNTFLQNLKTYKFTESINKRNKQWHIIIGPISVGKSSLLNKFLNLKLTTGVGQTTLQAKIVSESDRTVIMDSPGANQDFDFFDIKNLALFKNVDRVFILYNTSLKQVAQICKIMKTLKPSQTYLIRTKCDHFDNSQQRNQRGINQQLMIDRKQVKSLVNHQFPILATSGKKPLGYKDNQRAYSLIRND